LVKVKIKVSVLLTTADYNLEFI